MSTPTWQPGTLYQPGTIVQPSTYPAEVPAQPANADFENGTVSGWTATPVGGASTFQISSAQHFTGSYSGQWLGGTGTGNEGGIEANVVSDDRKPVAPGRSLTGEVYIKYNTTGHHDGSQGRARIYWYDASMVLLSFSNGTLVRGRGNNNKWVRSTVSGIAPANAAYASMGCWLTCRAGNIFCDSLSWNYVSAAIPTALVFRATQPSPGYSASSEPVWPSIAGQTVVDNEVTWEGVVASRVVWEAHAILESGSVEPVFPEFEGAVVADNDKIAWETVSGRVTDERCPHSPLVAIAASKVFAGDEDIVPFSATVNPLDWSTSDDAGYLPFGLQTYGANPVSALGLYRGNLVVFNSAAFQMWQVDQDPANMALLDAVPIGCTAPKSVQPVQNDLAFLSAVGIRSIGIAGASTNLQAGNFGEVIDPLVRAKVIANEYEPVGLFVPSLGQYWLFFGGEAFVLTNNGTKDESWSRYVFPEAVTDWTLADDALVLRTETGKVWVVDADALGDDEGFSVPEVGDFDIPNEAGEFRAWVNTVLLVRNQSGTGTPRTPDGYFADAGVAILDPPSYALVANVGGTAADFIVQIDGLDENGDAQSETIEVVDGALYTVGVKLFSEISSCMTTLTVLGSDGFWTVGHVQFIPDEGGDELVISVRGALAIRDNGTNPQEGMFGLSLPIDIPSGSVVEITGIFTSASPRAYTINGAEQIVLPAGVTGRTALGAVGYSTINTIVAGSGSAFVDIGFRLTLTQAGTPIQGVIQWPHLDFGSLGLTKQMQGLDVVANAPEGVNISIGYDQRDLNARTPDYLIDGDTLPGYMIGMPVAAPSFDLKLTFEPGQKWTWYASNLYIQDFRGGI